jgi:hypothetical protein
MTNSATVLVRSAADLNSRNASRGRPHLELGAFKPLVEGLLFDAFKIEFGWGNKPDRSRSAPGAAHNSGLSIDNGADWFGKARTDYPDRRHGRT